MVTLPVGVILSKFGGELTSAERLERGDDSIRCCVLLVPFHGLSPGRSSLFIEQVLLDTSWPRRELLRLFLVLSDFEDLSMYASPCGDER